MVRIARSLIQRNGTPSRFFIHSLSCNSILVAAVYPVEEWSSHLVSSLRVVPPLHSDSRSGPILLLVAGDERMRVSIKVWS